MPNLINNGVVIYIWKMLRMSRRTIILCINYPIAILYLIQLRQILCSCFTHFILLTNLIRIRDPEILLHNSI